jgi:hypothetical protein
LTRLFACHDNISLKKNQQLADFLTEGEVRTLCPGHILREAGVWTIGCCRIPGKEYVTW